MCPKETRGSNKHSQTNEKDSLHGMDDNTGQGHKRKAEVNASTEYDWIQKET